MKKSDYSRLPTEGSNPRSRRVDRASIEQTIEIINKEDALVPRAVYREKAEMAKTVRLLVKSIRSGGRIFLAGAGTSGRLGILEAAECPPTFSTPPSLIQAFIAGGHRAVFRSVEGAEDNEAESRKIFSKKLKAGDVLIGIAASGITPFVRGAFRAARIKKTKTVLVSCNPSSPMKKWVDCLIAPKVGPEVITGSTRLKAGTAAKLVLNTLTVCSMIQLGKVYQNWMVDVDAKNKKLTARALGLVEYLGKVKPRKAWKLFQESRRNVKVAIVMARKNCAAGEARNLLRHYAGFLGKIIES